jgi:hypothetical protein
VVFKRKKIKMIWCFINHTKHHIEKTNNFVHKNISKFLFEVIRDNKWSIGDQIELANVHSNNEKIKKMIENEYYYCSEESKQWLYN